MGLHLCGLQNPLLPMGLSLCPLLQKLLRADPLLSDWAEPSRPGIHMYQQLLHGTWGQVLPWCQLLCPALATSTLAWLCRHVHRPGPRAWDSPTTPASGGTVTAELCTHGIR